MESEKQKRNNLAAELLQGCPEESLADHTAIAAAVRSGADLKTILAMSEADRWPETYAWLTATLTH